MRALVVRCIQPPNERSRIAASMRAGAGSKVVSRRDNGSRRKADGSMSRVRGLRPGDSNQTSSTAVSGDSASRPLAAVSVTAVSTSRGKGERRVDAVRAGAGSRGGSATGGTSAGGRSIHVT